jgi:hypothetical protein
MSDAFCIQNGLKQGVLSLLHCIARKWVCLERNAEKIRFKFVSRLG